MLNSYMVQLINNSNVFVALKETQVQKKKNTRKNDQLAWHTTIKDEY